MIICVEGNVHSGKTTFIENFVKQNINFAIVSESKFQKNLSPFDRQLSYINQERNKKHLYSSKNLILDRSILSVLAYTIFTSELLKEQKNELIKIILDGIYNKEFIIPDKLYFMVLDNKQIQINHKSLKLKKQTQDILVSNDYLKFYDDFFAKLLAICKLEKTIQLDKRIVKVYDCSKLFKNFAAGQIVGEIL